MIVRASQVPGSRSRFVVRKERGVALIFALVVLFILMILGVSALRTSSLEQLMSGNIQDQTRALEAADSGMEHALNAIQNGTSADPTTYTFAPYTYAVPGGTTAMNTTAVAQSPTFLQTGPVGRNSTPSGSSICANYYDQAVSGTTTTYARSNLHQGLAVPGAKCPAVQ